MPDRTLQLHATNLADHYHFELPPEGFQPNSSAAMAFPIGLIPSSFRKRRGSGCEACER